MEGKTVILSVLVMSLVMAQIQVEAKICCSTVTSRNVYNVCRISGQPQQVCARLSGCTLVSGSLCPQMFTLEILENSGDALNEYCNLGCVSSVCGALTTLPNSDASEIMNGAIAQCNKACSTFCNKGSNAALEAA